MSAERKDRRDRRNAIWQIIAGDCPMPPREFIRMFRESEVKLAPLLRREAIRRANRSPA